MTPFVQDADFTLYLGDALDVLRELPDESVHCCVTSPPYWGLRDYGHDGQLGLELSPEEYVAALVTVFAEVRRVLRSDGTCWLNLGDSYNTYAGNRTNDGEISRGRGHPDRPQGFGLTTPTLKQKDIVGIPWRVAFALQADGWYLRSDTIEEVEFYCPCGCGHIMEERIWRYSQDREIVWAKPNPMPESVRDRPTKAHEYLFLLTKSARYFYDAAAIAEPATWYGPNGQPKSGPHAGQMHGRAGKNPTWEERKAAGATRGNVAFDGNVGAGTQRGVHGEGVSHDLGDGLTRNARSVWTIQTQQYADAHFAVYPEELPRRCVLAGCPEGGTVLDPFMGSGTTALVARRLGRRSVGIELNPEYARLAAARLSQLSLLADGTAA